MNKKLSSALLAFLLIACDSDQQSTSPAMPGKDNSPETSKAAKSLSAKDRQTWFGEMHIHSNFSVDASIYNVPASPDEAYRYAKGEAVSHSGGGKIQSSRPIDFMALTDHAEYLGVIERLKDPRDPLSTLSLANDLISDDESVVKDAFITISSSMRNRLPLADLMQTEVMASSWQTIIDTAERHNEPGKFTTFIAYEWTSNPNSRNLHRNVIFREGPGQVPALPFSAFDSQQPEDLWAFMDSVRAQGMPVLAIPHNSNLSDGLMFPIETDSWGKPLDSNYAATRNRNEPLVEIAQIKGASDIHPSLSPNDEWANFEIMDEMFETVKGERAAGDKSRAQGGYIRQALKDGLVLMDRQQYNPYKFGIIAATDSHNSSVPTDENNYTGKIGIADDTAAQRKIGVTAGLTVRKWGGAAGLAGVWAEQNTRGSLFDAMTRKETFATSGPRIKLRFFGGWDFPDNAMQSNDWPTLGYNNGAAMGADLPAQVGSVSPRFMLWAEKDPDEADLQRLQVIKAWVDNGKAHEKVFDVACADGLAPSNDSYRCPAGNATVDLSDCSLSAGGGDVELSIVWQDPEFKSDQRAVYYVRALQKPTCRWSTWDAIRNDWPLLEDVPATIQERAWSSPIWYKPS